MSQFYTWKEIGITYMLHYKQWFGNCEIPFRMTTVAPLLSPVQEVSSSSNHKTIEMNCYLTGGTAYLLDQGKEWCNSVTV